MSQLVCTGVIILLAVVFFLKSFGRMDEAIHATGIHKDTEEYMGWIGGHRSRLGNFGCLFVLVLCALAAYAVLFAGK